VSAYKPPEGYMNGPGQRHGAGFEVLFACELVLRGAEVALSISHFTGWDLVCVSKKGRFLVDVKHIGGTGNRMVVKPRWTGCDFFALWHKGIWHLVPAPIIKDRCSVRMGSLKEWGDRWDLML